jgi:hypothetical protein
MFPPSGPQGPDILTPGDQPDQAGGLPPQIVTLLQQMDPPELQMVIDLCNEILGGQTQAAGPQAPMNPLLMAKMVAMQRAKMGM